MTFLKHYPNRFTIKQKKRDSMSLFSNVHLKFDAYFTLTIHPSGASTSPN